MATCATAPPFYHEAALCLEGGPRDRLLRADNPGFVSGSPDGSARDELFAPIK